MKRSIAVTALLMPLLSFAILGTVPALAFTEAPPETTAEEVGSSGVTPAEEAPPAAVEEEDQPWTARFLAPAVFALGVLITVATVVGYGWRVRSRYEVVD